MFYDLIQLNDHFATNCELVYLHLLIKVVANKIKMNIDTSVISSVFVSPSLFRRNMIGG